MCRRYVLVLNADEHEGGGGGDWRPEKPVYFNKTGRLLKASVVMLDKVHNTLY